MSASVPENPDRLIAELNALLGAAWSPPAAKPPPEAPSPAIELRPPAAQASRPVMELRPPPPPKFVVPQSAGPQAAVPQEQPQTPPKASSRRILIVDDDADYREVLKFLLVENSYVVLEAADGVEGLRMAVECLPDLVLSDFNMPGLNGFELIQRLRANFETRSIPIVMFTGAANRRHLQKTVGLDIVDFLEKPVSNARLLNAVKKAFEKVEASKSTHEPARPAHHPLTGARPAPAQPSEAVPAEEPQDELIGDAVEPMAGDGDLQVDSDEAKTEEEVGLEGLANDSSLISRVNQILIRAVDMGASDVHIEPQEKQILVRVRLNGSLQKLMSLSGSMNARLSARVKIMSNLVITERRRPQDGQFRAKIKGKKVEFRVSTIPSTYGEKIVLRVLGGSKIKTNLGELGLLPRDLQCVEKALQTPHGLILVTGPTGSGKTTTLYTMLAVCNKPDVNIMTAEDPVEYELPGINQVHVKTAIGLTFESVLRSFLRQDPDIMLVGEIRDLETANIAVKASITGHLVLSTLHTNSAAATVTRLTHMGVAPFLVAASVKLIVAQRLVKLLCQECKVPGALGGEERRFLTEAELSRLHEIYRGLGCRACNQTGYKGRMPIMEVMPLRTPEMRQRILSSESGDLINELAVQEGMTSLRQAAINAVAAGQTAISEALKIILAD